MQVQPPEPLPTVWSTAASNWSASSAGCGANQAWAGSGNIATFAAGTDATGCSLVTVCGTVTALGLAFEDGTFTLCGGTIDFECNSGQIYVDAGKTATVKSILAGMNGITKHNSGTLKLNSANTYIGDTVINAGTVQISHANALGVTGNTSVNCGATLALTNNITLAETISIAGTGVASAGAINNAAGCNTISGNITLTAAASINTAAATELTLTGSVSGATELTKTGAGTLTLSSSTAGSFSADLQIDAGILKLGAADVIDDSSGITLNGGQQPAGGGFWDRLWSQWDVV